MDMRVSPEEHTVGPMTDHSHETLVSDARLDEMMRWHGSDETNLPPADTLRNLSRDTVAALRELQQARATIAELRATMGQAFWASGMRQVQALLLRALGPPPPDEMDS